MNQITLDNQADAALSKLQDTKLTPMEEALFKGWAQANQIEKPDAPDDHVDYRGIYKGTNGMILPNGQLKRFADNLNSAQKLQRVLHDKMMKHIETVTGNKLSEMPQEPETPKLTPPKHTPDEHKSLALQNEGVAQKNEGLAHQNEGVALNHKTIALQNEGKQLDIQKILAQRELAKTDSPSET